jgi:hypothetical protein
MNAIIDSHGFVTKIDATTRIIMNANPLRLIPRRHDLLPSLIQRNLIREDCHASST